jgi:FeS assembly SUF system protein
MEEEHDRPDVPTQLPHAGGEVDWEKLHQGVVEALESIFDPEIPVNIYELGLIYGIKISEDSVVDVTMTLTSPACPEAQSIPPTVEAEVRSVPGVKGAKVEVVWDPPWGPERMSEAAKLQLGFD